MKDIFAPNTNQFESRYPELLQYGDAIQKSYWTKHEFNFTSDIDDFRVKVMPSEKEAIKKTMLAISQIEIKVKRFWGNLYNRLPQPEIDDVGGIFAESEVRHKQSYSLLLKILGLVDEFENLGNVKAIKDREDYLIKYLDGSRSSDNRMYTKSVLLFSMFIEHVSLFSQFLIMMSFNKERNLFKGISNVVAATSKEEDIHGNFGANIIRIIKEENPHWFDKELNNIIISACKKAYEAECKILDWIFESGELEFLKKETIKNFIKNRFNKSLNSIGFDDVFKVDFNELDKVLWFDVELKATKENDDFNKRSVDYNKFSQEVSENSIF
jgi:ribonucleoside-diphosphate reductase beta chain